MMSIFDAYKTPLNTTDELAYQLAKNDSPFKYDKGDDYDLRGFWKQYGSLQPQATNGHLTDEFKLPWHETFSVQSKFYNGQPWAINPNGYTYLPDRFDSEVVQNGLRPWEMTIYDY